MIKVETEYTSKYFTQQYKNWQAAVGADAAKMPVQGKDHHIEIRTRTVTKFKNMAFTIQTSNPFQIGKRIEFINNSYFVQLSVQSTMKMPVYLDAVKFEVMAGLVVHDLNYVDKQSIFESSAAFINSATRDYLFQIKPVNESVMIDITKELQLGSLEINWRNYFGEKGSLKIVNYKSPIQKTQSKIELLPVQATLLKMEQSQKVQFRL